MAGLVAIILEILLHDCDRRPIVAIFTEPGVLLTDLNICWVSGLVADHVGCDESARHREVLQEALLRHLAKELRLGCQQWP